MPRGPLPSPTKRRRNAPAIPTTNLPAGGRKGPIPRVPKWVSLGPSGSAWWRWAWRTPQAAGWTPEGHLATVANRATLEDDLAALASVESLDEWEVLATEDMREVKAVIGRLASLVTGRLAILKEMRELDKVLGLTPKGMADLRWTIVAETEAPQVATPDADEVTQRRQERRARLSAS